MIQRFTVIFIETWKLTVSYLKINRNRWSRISLFRSNIHNLPDLIFQFLGQKSILFIVLIGPLWYYKNIYVYASLESHKAFKNSTAVGWTLQNIVLSTLVRRYGKVCDFYTIFYNDFTNYYIRIWTDFLWSLRYRI